MQDRVCFYHLPNGKWSDVMPGIPSPDRVRDYLNSDECPLSDVYVGPANKGNLDLLKLLAFPALQRLHRNARGGNFLLCAGSGQGKTYIMKKYAKTIGLPCVFVQSPNLDDTWTLFGMIQEEFARHKFVRDGLTEFEPGYQNWNKIKPTNEDPKAHFVLPPCLVVFDECHLLKPKLMKGGLLNAMERNDGYLQVKTPGVNGDLITVNCKEVCWIGATTERGMLFDALENRFSNTIEWAPATTDEVAAIVEMTIRQMASEGVLPFEMPYSICEKIGRYRVIPREAISFADLVVKYKNMYSDTRWEDCIERVARSKGYDEDGFSQKQVAILTALGQRAQAMSRMPNIAGCRLEQVERFELPRLFSYSNGGPLVVTLSRGLCITEAGLKVLDKKGIPHKGSKITAEHYEERGK